MLAKDIMRKKVVETTHVEKVAKVMIDSRIHRVLITKGEKLAGIVTTMDMMRALITLVKKTAPARRRSHAR